MEITRRELNPGIVTLEIRGPLQMGVECKRLEIAVDELLRENRTRVVLDLSGVSRLDSGGLGKIVNCLSRLKVAGGTLRLAGREVVVLPELAGRGDEQATEVREDRRPARALVKAQSFELS